MLHTIQNEYLTVTASEQGAELQSILGKDGTEYLWQGDPRYWSDRAMNIFPYVARLTEGCYDMDGRRHHMRIHGLAPYCRFSAEETDGKLVFTLRANDETRQVYPREFVFRVIYQLCGSSLAVIYDVENRDSRTMYFGLGGHPGFNVPLAVGKRFEDYRLRFSERCTPLRVGFTEDCFVSGGMEPFPLEQGSVLPLRHELFDADAIVLKDCAREVTLECVGDPHSVTVSFPDMPYLGLWHWPRTDAPYVCIEPWSSLPAKAGEITVMEEQSDLIRVEPGDRCRNQWVIRLDTNTK